ncbi:hypothetical protein CN09_09045 [Rhizobium rhizogenes]|nr:hypothetical protein CN09_09045 [Rhizobium rhizogenes]
MKHAAILVDVLDPRAFQHRGERLQQPGHILVAALVYQPVAIEGVFLLADIAFGLNLPSSKIE